MGIPVQNRLPLRVFWIRAKVRALERRPRKQWVSIGEVLAISEIWGCCRQVSSNVKLTSVVRVVGISRIEYEAWSLSQHSGCSCTRFSHFPRFMVELSGLAVDEGPRCRCRSVDIVAVAAFR